VKGKTAPNDPRATAQQAMIDRGLGPGFPPDAIRQLHGIQGPSREAANPTRGLRNLLWCSTDNSKHLDQLTAAARLPAGGVKGLVALADVDAVVKPGSAIRRHARSNTTCVYTAAAIFPMLPERLSTDPPPLGEGEDRLALLVEMVVATDGSIQESDVYRALVNNHAKLACRSVAACPDGKGKMPDKIPETKGLDEQLRTQGQIGQVVKSVRDQHGALEGLG
jgi:exoribonuclease II